MKKIILVTFGFLITLVVAGQTYKGASSSRQVEDKLNETYCTGLFKSTDGVILDVASSNSVTGYFNILDWLPGRVAGLQIYKSRVGTSIPVIRGGVPAIYLDEMPVSPSFLSSINVNDIAIVKVIKTPFFGGFNGAYGAIAIYTFGDEEEDELDN